MQNLLVGDHGQGLLRGDPFEVGALDLGVIAGTPPGGHGEDAHGQAREEQVTRRDEPIAAVAPAAAQDDDMRAKASLGGVVGNGENRVRHCLSRPLHKNDGRHAVFVEGVLLDAADLTTSRHSHRCLQILQG